MTHLDSDFVGAKIAILRADRVLTILRDAKPDIPFPDRWDLPGGGREAGEAPLDTALRETREELGLDVPPGAVCWQRRLPHANGPGHTWFFAAEWPRLDLSAVHLGDEGQRWALMPVTRFLAHPRGIAHLQDRLRLYLETRG